MTDLEVLEECLSKVNVKLFDGGMRSFIDVLSDLPNVWDALNDTHKDKIYDAMGIKSEPQKTQLWYPEGVRGVNLPFNPHDNDIGIKYLDMQPTCIGDKEVK